MRTDLITPTTRLQRATKKLQDKWLATQPDWDDSVRERFQEKHLDPIVPKLQLTVSAIHELASVLDEAIAATVDEENSI